MKIRCMATMQTAVKKVDFTCSTASQANGYTMNKVESLVKVVMCPTSLLLAIKNLLGGS